MENEKVVVALNKLLTELTISFGVLAVRHGVPDETVWEVVKHFDLLYQKARAKVEAGSKKAATGSHEQKRKPHPGIMHLLEKLRDEKVRIENG